MREEFSHSLALQRTAAGRRGCNRRALWPPSLSLGRRQHSRIFGKNKNTQTYMPDYNNKFATPAHIEETIVDATTGATIGTIRVKPSGLLWKPKGQRKYYQVSLDTFTAWITNAATGASRTGS